RPSPSRLVYSSPTRKTPERKTMNRKEIFDAATKAVCNDREEQYGHPRYSLGAIAELWSAYLGVQMSAADVSMLMCLLKIARHKANPAHMDNLVDLAGYAALASEMNPSDQAVAPVQTV